MSARGFSTLSFRYAERSDRPGGLSLEIGHLGLG